MYEFNGFPIVGKKIDENPEQVVLTGDEKIPILIDGVTKYVKLSNIVIDSTPGEDGEDGNKGWSPVIGIFTASDKKVFRVVNWVGGEGAKPAFGQYIGASGLVSNIADAVQIDFNLPFKADLIGGKVPASQLPTYVDDVLEYNTLFSFPATGETGKIYVAIDTKLQYRWSGSAYINIGGGLLTGADDNTFEVGISGNDNPNNEYNVAIGRDAMKNADGTSVNVAVGYAALKNIINSSYNTAVGPNAGINYTSGEDFNTILGQYLGAPGENHMVSIADGYLNLVIQIDATDRTPGRVLTTDANGVGRFVTPLANLPIETVATHAAMMASIRTDKRLIHVLADEVDNEDTPEETPAETLYFVGANGVKQQFLLI